MSVQDAPPEGGQIVVYRGDRHVYLRPLPENSVDAEHMHCDWPPERVPVHARLLAVAYWDTELAKRVLVALGRRHQFLIDTDFGEIYSSAGFARRCAAEPGWDWQEWLRPRAEGTVFVPY